ncbi:AI-2E family transporter [Sulfitobacter sp. F26204]|uniref:AI-2E family transporter n=1 Tax=Sulfitobacter sp. F26204 TaxID=2996014 RepID=UPI00225E1531|nr:AI-2E family transporter [Sulfitobacter sp. F26204]MCX7560198.1 AI-2E family transporter [Sulfitobacter sp. F26204]
MDQDIKAIRRSLGLLSVLAVFVVVYFARDFILPVLLGCLLALTLSPINRWLQKVGLPAGVGAAILVTFTAAAIIGVIVFAGETARSWTDSAPDIALELRQKLSGVSKQIDAVKDASEQVQKVADAPEPGKQEVVVKPPGLLSSAMTVVASTATSIGVALVLALFLLASGELFYAKLVQSFTTLSEKKRALATVYEIERQVSGYLLTITIINIGLGLSVAGALWLLGLEYAYVWGVAAFLLNFLPILGGVVGTALVAVHAILFFDSLSYAMLAPICYLTLTSSEAQFVTPFMIGKRMELNIVAVFLTVVLWGWLWGVPGALVAVPFLLVFKVVCDNFTEMQAIGNFLGPARPTKMDKRI